ncbi:MAG: UDP-2,3-diacylglucosamine diphosphatase LpxI [Pseudomonadota bacterium]
MPEPGGPATTIAIISGRGALPRRVAETRSALDLPTYLVIFPDCFEDWMSGFPHGLHEFERLGRLFRELRDRSVTHVLFAGAMNRPKIRLWRLDLKTITVAVKAIGLLRKGDDAMLRGYAQMIESEGFKMVGAQEILGEDLTLRRGMLGRHGPDEAAKADAARAHGIVAALGPHDVGQGAVVAGGLCLAVEAIEGTDLMLKRVGDLPPERRASAPPPSGVLFKGPKPGQDRRLDTPTIGPETVRGAASAGLRGIVAIAGETVLIEPDETRIAADNANLFVYGATHDELAAWS